MVLSRRALYIAVLLHDISKGRGSDHSELGAKVAQKVCPQLGLDEAETETVAWLVLHHLAMSDTAFKRDIDDTNTIRDFADLVQSPERLRLLLVLTVADRSDEHTSELQSLMRTSYAVFCFKKKQTQYSAITCTRT